jgi:hypothetical protein
MIRKLVEAAKKWTPAHIKNIFIVYKSKKRFSKARALRNTIIKNWEVQGKPLPAPHEIKQVAVEHYQKISGYKVLIETGTYMGDMIEAQKANFEKIYSVELSMGFWKRAVIRFKKYGHIKIIQGDSGKVLFNLAKDLTTPAIFWLDGHYSGGDTARGEKECPVLDEIEAIAGGDSMLKHILLIDDARLFTGKNDYPAIAYLTEYVQSKYPGYQVLIKDDVIICM